MHLKGVEHVKVNITITCEHKIIAQNDATHPGFEALQGQNLAKLRSERFIYLTKQVQVPTSSLSDITEHHTRDMKLIMQ